MAEHEGINDKTKVQDDHGKKTVDAVGFLVQGLPFRNADIYQLREKPEIRVVTGLRLLEGNSGWST